MDAWGYSYSISDDEEAKIIAVLRTKTDDEIRHLIKSALQMKTARALAVKFIAAQFLYDRFIERSLQMALDRSKTNFPVWGTGEAWITSD